MSFENVGIKSRFMMEDFAALFANMVPSSLVFTGDVNLRSVINQLVSNSTYFFVALKY